MAKKVVATLKTSTGKSFAKVIRMVRSPKTNAYTFQEEIVPSEEVQAYLTKKENPHLRQSLIRRREIPSNQQRRTNTPEKGFFS